jgi:hypothetical protein
MSMQTRTVVLGNAHMMKGGKWSFHRSFLFLYSLLEEKVKKGEEERWEQCGHCVKTW